MQFLKCEISFWNTTKDKKNGIYDFNSVQYWNVETFCLQEALLQLTQLQLVHLMSVAIFNIQRCKHRNFESDNLTEEDTSLWHVSLLFCVQFFQTMLEHTSEMVANQFSVTELKCLPAIKLFTDWIVCSGSNTLAQEAFQENLKYSHSSSSYSFILIFQLFFFKSFSISQHCNIKIELIKLIS